MRKILKYSDKVASVEIVELEPQCRTLKIAHCENCASEKKYHAYYLSLPYMQFYRLEKTDELYFSASFTDKPFEIKKAISGDKKFNKVCLPCLPNCMGAVCMPKGITGFNMERLIGSFFNSIFCDRESHDGSNYSPMPQVKLESYSNWQQETKKDPSFIMNREWWQYSERDLIYHLIELHPPFGEFLE